MPIHDVGYRRWEGRLESPWLRWTVIAGAGIRLVWKSHWVRRMLFASWLPAAGLGIIFFVYEQALERPLNLGIQEIDALRAAGQSGNSGAERPEEAMTRQAIQRIREMKAKGQLPPNGELARQLETLERLEREGKLLQAEQEIRRRAEQEARRLARRQAQRALPSVLGGLPHSEAAQKAWMDDPTSSRHAVWSLLLHFFFRYPQGTLMVLLVGMVAPSLVSLDFRSRAFLLYFSRPITPLEYVFGKATVIWCYLAAITTLPALALYFLGVLLSPDIGVVACTWDLPFRIIAASLVLMIPTTALALFFSSLTTESRYAGFAWFAVWGLGWTAYSILQGVFAGKQWSIVSLYHMLGRVQAWVFGLATDINDVTSAAAFLIIVTVLSLVVLMTRVAAPMRV